MNVWECQVCGAKSQGVGGAIGLRAIGWWFELGPVILCPHHRPDRVPCHEEAGTPCPMCAGEEEAQRLQEMIRRELGDH